MQTNLVIGFIAVSLAIIARDCNADNVGALSKSLSSFASPRSGSLGNDCGGYIKGLVGGINYKLNQPLADREACIWTVEVPLKTTILVRLVDGPVYYTNTYILNIYSMDKGVPEPRQAINVGLAENTTYTIHGGPIYQFVLSTYGARVPGFALGFLGVGPNQSSLGKLFEPPTYKVFQQKGASSGLIQYTKPTDQERSTEIVSLSLHPAKGKQIQAKLSVKLSKPQLDLYPCYEYSGTLLSYEVGWLSGGGEMFQRSSLHPAKGKQIQAKLSVKLSKPQLDLYPCYEYSGTLLSYEVGWLSGGGEMFQRSSECRSNHTTTVTTPLPMLITYKTVQGQGRIKDQIEIEWSMVD